MNAAAPAKGHRHITKLVNSMGEVIPAATATEQAMELRIIMMFDESPHETISVNFFAPFFCPAPVMTSVQG